MHKMFSSNRSYLKKTNNSINKNQKERTLDIFPVWGITR